MLFLWVLFLIQVLVPFLVRVQVPDPVSVPVPVPVPDQTWSRSLVPVPVLSYFWSRLWSRSQSRHISGPGLGPGPGQNFWSRHTVLNSHSKAIYFKHIVQQMTESTTPPEILGEEGIDNSNGLSLSHETREEDISIDCNPIPQSNSRAVSQPKEGICSSPWLSGELM